MALSALFIVIAILLINSSIRLSVYSKRMIIKTMQLVGATKRFIRRPFIWKHLQLGILGAFLACGALGYMLYELNLRFPELNLLGKPEEAGLIFAAVIATGHPHHRHQHLFRYTAFSQFNHRCRKLTHDETTSFHKKRVLVRS